ncbi:hypothetical protein K443DRAFT_10053 [Laccaria amethystina LaAM-08-1]|uniref:Uncharacterized protein n=1 Tax=Laccaria amethystina LaAM-08-1 TaxID=1095629 RepID=A0A0C9XHR4_9AGAR|nr:hypothetical protein K443DRAFT_10053 [Laccaria amethystina LaAM-08-1]
MVVNPFKGGLDETFDSTQLFLSKIQRVLLQPLHHFHPFSGVDYPLDIQRPSALAKLIILLPIPHEGGSLHKSKNEGSLVKVDERTFASASSPPKSQPTSSITYIVFTTLLNIPLIRPYLSHLCIASSHSPSKTVASSQRSPLGPMEATSFSPTKLMISSLTLAMTSPTTLHPRHFTHDTSPTA